MIDGALFDGALLDGALRGGPHWLHLDDDCGPQQLSVTRWHGVPDIGDELMLSRCQGATLDLGCGPGRLTGALAARGVIVLGIDISSRAVQLTLRRGGVALRRDVFDPLPGQGRWDHALLADGNIGIGGDAGGLLGRLRELLAPGGAALIEVDPLERSEQFTATVAESEGEILATFPWVRIGAGALVELATPLGYDAQESWDAGDRRFVALRRCAP